MFTIMHIFASHKGCPKTGAHFLWDGFVMSSVRIPTKRMYSVVHYLFTEHPRTFVCQTDLALQLVL